MLSLRINGEYAQTFGYGRVEVEEIAHLFSSTGGGIQYIRFSLALPRGYSHPALVAGSLVEAEWAGVPLGTTTMADPNREDWTFVADGLFRRAEYFNAEGANNSPAVVVAAANVRGMGWNGVGNLPSTPIPVDDNGRLTMVSDVLNEYCRLNNKRWGLTVDNVPYIADDPATVSCALRPGTPAMATSADDYKTRVLVRFIVTEGTETDPPVYDFVEASSADTPNGTREAYEDLSSMGVLAEVDAQAYADAFIAANIARRGFTEAIEVAPGQLTNLGDTPIHPWIASREVLGRRLLQHNILETDGRVAYGQTRNWVVGSTIWKPASRSVVLTPTGLLARTQAQAFASDATTALREKAGIAT